MSSTVTCCVPVVVSPWESVAVQWTVVVPWLNSAGASFVTVTLPQASEAVAVPRLTAWPEDEVHSTVTSAGTVRLGAVVSSTVTCCVPVVVSPWESVAVQWTVVVPCGKRAGASFVTVTDPQASEADAVPRLTACPDGEVHSTVMSAGTLRLGGVVSTTFTACVAEEWFPESSVAVQVTVVVPYPKRTGALFVTAGEGSHASDTVADPSVTACPSCEVHSTVTFAGAVIEGGVVSTTVTRCVFTVFSPWESVAVQVTVVVP